MIFRSEVDIMDFTKATNKQLKVIIEHDGEVPASLLHQILEEVIRRDLYQNYIGQILIRRYGTLQQAEQLMRLTFDEIKYLCYEQAFETLRFYKPGKNNFLSFWSSFIANTIKTEIRKYTMQKRSADTQSIDDENVHVQIVNDHNTERKVINRMMIESLFKRMSEKEQFIVMKLAEGYSYIEISKMCGYGRNYANNIHYKMIKRLKGA